MKLDIIQTLDGSNTLYSEKYHDHYHSVHGALAESMHIFIKCGLNQIMLQHKKIHILEVGFGTGLNALCTLDQAYKYDLEIDYEAVEPEPVDLSFVSRLQYPELFTERNYQNEFHAMHCVQKNEKHDINQHFRFKLIDSKIQDVSFLDSDFHLVYFDLFRPDLNANLWNSNVFAKIFNTVKMNGMLITYSSSGSVRRAMKDAGFNVEKISGPDGKREISKATKRVSFTL